MDISSAIDGHPFEIVFRRLCFIMARFFGLEVDEEDAREIPRPSNKSANDFRLPFVGNHILHQNWIESAKFPRRREKAFLCCSESLWSSETHSRVERQGQVLTSVNQRTVG